MLADVLNKSKNKKEIYFNAWRYHRKAQQYLTQYSPNTRAKVAFVDSMAKDILMKNFSLDLVVRILVLWTGEKPEVVYRSLR